MTCYRWEGEDLILFIHVQPRSSQTTLVGLQGDRLKIKITAAPVDGQANAEIYKLFSKLFGVAKSKITLIHGLKSRDKCFRIESPKKWPSLITPPCF